MQAPQPSLESPADDPGSAVSVPTADDGLLVVAVRDGVAELEEAVVLRQTAARLFVELGEDLNARRIAEELTRQGAGARAEADSRRFRAQLVGSGLAPRTDGEEGPDALECARATLKAADIERLARAVLARGCALRYRALGRSMRPAIPNGSFLDVEPLAFDDVRLGQVVLYSAADGARLVAHRVRARRSAELLLARGDSSTRTDEVRRANYLGLVRRITTPAGGMAAVSDGAWRWLGLGVGTLHELASRAARLLVLRPLRASYGRRSLLRASLGAVLRLLSGVLLRLERWARRARRPLDVGRAGLLTAEEKDAGRRALYARQAVQSFTALEENLSAGLTPIEELVVARHLIPAGKALVLGCGPGREALELAARGFEVTGLDREEGMLARARSLAARAGHDVRFVRGEAFEFRVDGAPFDVVVIFSGLINMLLPRARRVRTLACAFEHLSPGGRVLLTFLSAYHDPRAGVANGTHAFWRAVNPEHEAGDYYLINETVHVYPAAERLSAEAREAGFEVEVVHRDQRAYDKADGLVRGYAVLRRPA